MLKSKLIAFLKQVISTWTRKDGIPFFSKLLVGTTLFFGTFFFIITPKDMIGASTAKNLCLLMAVLPLSVVTAYHMNRLDALEQGKERDKNNILLEKEYQIHGSCEIAKREEKMRMWGHGKIEDVVENIVGLDPDNPKIVYTLDPNKKAMKIARDENGDIIKDKNGRPKYKKLTTPALNNNNTIVFGPPGSGKGIGYIAMLIMQIVRRKYDSAVIADSKGEAYARFAYMLRAYGVETRMIELNPHIMEHSDAINLMSGVYDEIKAIDFVNTIMVNTGEKDGIADNDFWGKNERNLLLACVLYVMGDPTHSRGKSVADIYNSLTENPPAELQNMLKETSSNANIFSNMDTTKASDVQTGLNIRLSLLGNKIIQKITGEDEVSFDELGHRRMVYFLSMSDHGSTMKFLQAVFFTLIIGALTDYADFETEQKKLPCRVTFLLDEFRNIGRIPDFDRVIATSRGRNIDFSIILQNLNQLQEMYPNGGWENILDCFSTWILLGTNTKTTSEYFEWRAGIGTAWEKSISYTEDGHHAFDPRVSPRHVSLKAAPYKVAPSGRLLRMDPDEIFVATYKHNCCFLQRLVYWEHPLAKTLLQTNSANHVSEWAKKLLKEVEDGVTDEDVLKNDYGIEYESWKALVEKDKRDYEEAVRLHNEFMKTWNGIETRDDNEMDYTEEDESEDYYFGDDLEDYADEDDEFYNGDDFEDDEMYEGEDDEFAEENED